jgi:uncharacterized membrane protein
MMMFGSLFFFVLFGMGLWWLVQQQQQGGLGPHPPQQSDPIEVARMRYARGDITREEYEQIRSVLVA